MAIILVVFGHLVARQDPAHIGWYEPLRRAVYAFHMPLFLYLSGLVAAESGFLLRGRAALPHLAATRGKRLLLPFFGLGLGTLLLKLAAMHFMFVDNAPPGFWPGLRALVWDTSHSPALFIWYVFVLYVVSLVAVAWLDGRRDRLPWLLAASLVLFWAPLPAYIYLDRLGMFAPFFLLGAAAGFAGPVWERVMDRAWPYAMVLFLAALAAIIVFDQHWATAEKLILLPVGAVSLPAIHGILRNFTANWLQQAFARLGRYSFMIYLFNTLCIGAAKGLLFSIMSWDGPNFLPFAMVLMCAGLGGPVVLKQYALKRVKLLDRLTD